MSAVAYSPDGAAEAAAVGVQQIHAAISAKELRTRVLGDRAVITKRDLAAWVNLLPVLEPKKGK